MPSTKMKKQKRNKGRFTRLPRGANGGVELLLIQSVDNLGKQGEVVEVKTCLLYTSPSPRDKRQSRMPSSA